MIFYFTGTGNSLYAAKMLDSEIFSIPKIMKGDNFRFKAEKIGIVCPVYGHEMPAMVKDFIQKAIFDTDYLFAVLTYGNRHGGAVELAAAEFERAGKKADYITTLLMVDNFLPAFDMDKQKEEDKHTDEFLAKIKSDTESEKRCFQPVSAKDRAAHKALYVSMKLLSGKRSFEEVWANFDFTDSCVGCGICAKVCPAGCIDIKNQRAVCSGINCQACYACVQACPASAVKMKKVMGLEEKNPNARYRNKHIALSEIIAANNQK